MINPVAAAAMVHTFTGLGIVCALLATRATLAGAYEHAFFWLSVAFFIDGVDGMLARRYRVLEVMPKVSGETLDLVIDYVTYVFVPALMLLQARFLDGPLGLLLASLICLSSLYHFSDEGSKSKDNCFVGFPAIWNIVAFYIFAFQPSGLITTGIILACVVLTFIPMKWVHPLRVESLWPATLTATVAWSLAAAATVYGGFPATGLSKLVLLVVAGYGLGLVLWFGLDRERYGP